MIVTRIKFDKQYDKKQADKIRKNTTKYDKKQADKIRKNTTNNMTKNKLIKYEKIRQKPSG